MDVQSKGAGIPWQEAVSEAFRRSVGDPEFRALCLADARKALAKVGAGEVPEGMKIRFVNEPDELVLVLPPVGAGAMSDEELDLVAGGAPSVWGGGTGSAWGGGTGSVWANPSPQAGVPRVGPNAPHGGVPYGYGTYYGTATGAPPLLPPGGAPPGY